MREFLSIAVVACLTVSAIAQDCYIDASGRRVCPLQRVVRGAVMAPVRILHAVTQPNIVVDQSTQIYNQPVPTCAPVVGNHVSILECAPVQVQQQAPVCGCGCGRVGCNCQANCGRVNQQVNVNVYGGGGSRYDIALRSAQYRAARGIKGHCSIEMGYTAGVGWASHDSNPTTCLGRGGANYAVVRGRDGWYSTKIQ